MRLIDRRIVEAVRRAVARGYKPKRFYLIPEDLEAYAGSRNVQPSPIDGIEIRRSAAASSYLICVGAVTIFLPKPHCLPGATIPTPPRKRRAAR